MLEKVINKHLYRIWNLYERKQFNSIRNSIDLIIDIFLGLFKQDFVCTRSLVLFCVGEKCDDSLS